MPNFSFNSEMHRTMKQVLCRNTFSSSSRALYHGRFRSRQSIFLPVLRTRSFSSTTDFRVATSALFNEPERNHFCELPKQSSSSLLTIILGLCVGAAILFGRRDPPKLDLKEISPIPYPPLSAAPDSFRTLVLLPGTGSSPIRCKLVSDRLSKSPSYEALSYQWGDQKQLRAIFVNNVKVAVTENLWLALSSIRHAQHPKSLWVDAICINQGDNDEKALQIPIMGSIYQRAKSVIIYLGNHKPYNDLHLQPSTLDGFEATVMDAVKSHNYTEQGPTPAQDVDSATPEKQQDLMEQKVQGVANRAVREGKVARVGMDYFLRNLIHEEYWKRGWIIQEVVMASENLVVRYGDKSVSWEEFVHWIRGYHQRYPKDESVGQIAHLDDMRQLRSRPGSVLTLAALLDAFKDCFTSQRQNGIYHDKIYAFLGLAHDCPSGSFPVSYKRSAAQIYNDCVTYFWKNSSMTPKQRAIELVYFSSLIRRLLTREPALRRKPARPFGEHPYEAGVLIAWQDSQSEHMQQTKDRSIIGPIIIGICMGAIQGLITGIWSGISEARITSQEWFWKASEAEDLTLWVSDQDKSDESTRDLFVRGMIVDEIKHIGPLYTAVMGAGNEVNDWSLVATNSAIADTNPTTQKEMLAKITTLVQFLRATTGDYVARMLCPPQVFSVPKIHNLPRTAADTHEDIPRIFFGTDSSVGLVPPEAQAGDLICRFWNSNTFAIVRMEQQKKELLASLSRENFKLVGRAIVADANLPDEEVSLQLNGELFGVVNERAIDIPVSLVMLTHLTLDTIFWEGT